MELIKEQLLNIKTYSYMDTAYIRVIDIPNPYRSEFISDSCGSTCPLIPNEGECHYRWDWEKWLEYRFEKDYTLRFPSQYREIADEECSAEKFWNRLNNNNKPQKINKTTEQTIEENINDAIDHLKQLKINLKKEWNN